MTEAALTVGVIADTHGLLRPQVPESLQGVAHILHLGDVGDAAILDALAAIAPVTAIRGNIDGTGRCAQLPATEYVTMGGHTLYLLHDLHTLDLDPAAAGIDVVLSGHSHRPALEERNGVLYFNPGAAGPRRFSLPVSLGLLHLAPGAPARAEHIQLG